MEIKFYYGKWYGFGFKRYRPVPLMNSSTNIRLGRVSVWLDRPCCFRWFQLSLSFYRAGGEGFRKFKVL